MPIPSSFNYETSGAISNQFVQENMINFSRICLFIANQANLQES